ncbi:MAG: hypothetical protein AAB691_00670 [Patescibacteria group bacterium]
MDFFSQPDFWIRYFYFLRGFFIIYDILLLGIVIYAVRKAWRYRPKLHPDHESEKRIVSLADKIIQERWDKVAKRFATGTPEGLTLSVIEADKIVDDVLKSLGLEGEHMADRLGQLSPEEVGNLEGVWRAHRLRNNLVHSPDFKASPDEIERALDSFEKFLKEIKAL